MPEHIAADFPIRQATLADAPQLRTLIALSVRELQQHDYSPAQLAIAVRTVFTLDTQLIADGTYFVIEDQTPAASKALIACGGWSARQTLCGGDSSHATRDNTLLNPATDPARIRAFFIHPHWARRGLGSRLLAHCEQAAQSAGFHRFEMAATLTGVPLYRARGYQVVEHSAIPLGNPCNLNAPGSNPDSAASNLEVVVMSRSILNS